MSQRFTALSALAAAIVPARADDAPDTPPSGHVEIEEVQVAFIGSGTLGGGKLTFEGRTHEFNVGGLGVGAGLALAAKMDKKKYMTVVILGDGECYEGSVWEAAMFAGHHRLDIPGE